MALGLCCYLLHSLVALVCSLLFCCMVLGVHPMSVFSVSAQVMMLVFVLSASPLFLCVWAHRFPVIHLVCLAFGVFIRFFLLLSLSRLLL